MISGLVGNKNIERILLFLFVNDKCYGTQIQTLLGCALTPLQKALNRLEKEGIIYSHFEGKAKIYRLSPSYPLIYELEMLLKKAYTFLPPQEKKKYCFLHKPRLSLQEEGRRERHRKKELTVFWEKLSSVSKLLISTKLRENETPTTQSGKAEVKILTPSPNTLIFQEKGYWLSEGLPSTSFSNSFRWTLDLHASLITLEHLRYGATHPIFLLHFTLAKSNMLESVDAHLCAQDTYLGNIVWDTHSIDFHWRVIGPKKNNQLLYHYT